MPDSISADKLKLDSELNLSKEFVSPTFEEWKAKVENDLKGASYEKKMITKTYEKIDLKPIYTNEDLEKLNITNSLPGFTNFARGECVNGYFANSWNVNQEIIEADAEDFNNALAKSLNNGQNCINLSLDSATKNGVDADYAKWEDVGDIGLSISAIKSLERALNNIDLNKYELSVHTGSIALPFLSLVSSFYKSRNLKPEFIKGTISADPIFELVSSGELNYDEKFIFNSMKFSIEWTKINSSNLKVIGVNTLPFINAGANNVQELAIALSIFVYYVDSLIELGISGKDIFNRTQFTLGVSTNYFMEIAKFRAVRILLNNIAEIYNFNKDKINFNIGAKTSKYYHTKLDPYVNLLRNTTLTFSAVLGGVNSISTSPFDEIIGLPDNISRRIARNTQTVLREESHLDQVIDPAGGSYFIESLTEELAKNSWEYFKKIENNGGILECLRNNFIQTEIENISAERTKDINLRKAVLVGTNMYANVKEKPINKNNFDHKKFHEKRSEYLSKFRTNGNSDKHETVIRKLNSISNSTEYKIIDLMSEAYFQGATIGEITSSLTSSHKNEIVIKPLVQKRASEDFEELRNMSLTYKSKHGFLPSVFLANMGSIKDYKARSEFSKGFFEVGGFEVFDPPGFTNIDNLVNEIMDSDTAIVVICSTDDKYPKLVPQITEAIKIKNDKIQIILAGYPKDQIEQHKNSGVDDFIYLGCDTLKILTSLHNKLGGQE